MTDGKRNEPQIAQVSHREKEFRTDIGVNATVQHLEMKQDDANPINRQLIELGLAAQASEQAPTLKEMKYCGSAAVHIYKSEVLGQLFFISQTDPLLTMRCPEMVAAAAFNHLLATMKKSYGHKRGRLRSGF